MSVSSVAGAYPRNWTPIQNRRDDAAQQTAESNISSPDESSTPAMPFAYLRSPTDSIEVSLPNGMSVGIFHFGAGSSGFDAQMLQSLEDLVSNLSAYKPPSKGTADETQPGTTGDRSKLSGFSGDMQGMQAIDMIHVDLPNGITIEARHGSAHDGAFAAMKEMEEEVEELVGHFTNEGNGSAVSTSAPAGAAASQHGPSSYADQARRTNQTGLAAGLGLSRQS